ncbi:hypothetical protein DFJ73DRAFT_900341 [Zopfochytrium polystomum]|nr:hypothetical protein DFJ73DRAFT_900341 [Zopfochytrium polystomum]
MPVSHLPPPFSLVLLPSVLPFIPDSAVAVTVAVAALLCAPTVPALGITVSAAFETVVGGQTVHVRAPVNHTPAYNRHTSILKLATSPSNSAFRPSRQPTPQQQKVGEPLTSGTHGEVHHATSNGNPAIYKTLHDGQSWGENEIAATKAAKQLIAHDDKRMVQHKVGTQGLSDYLKNKKDNPGGWTPDSKEIVRQIEKHQDKAGYRHRDVNINNVRVDTTKTSKKTGAPKIKLVDWAYAEKPSSMPASQVNMEKTLDKNFIARTCKAHGFEFRSAGRLYRRAGAACTAKQANPSAKPAAGNARSATSTAAVRQKEATKEAPSKAKLPLGKAQMTKEKTGSVQSSKRAPVKTQSSRSGAAAAAPVKKQAAVGKKK